MIIILGNSRLIWREERWGVWMGKEGGGGGGAAYGDSRFCWGTIGGTL